MNYEKLIRELVDKKAEQDNQIDLNAYENGMRALAKQLALCNVVKPFFCNNCNSQRYNLLTPITYQCKDCGTLQAK
jgi:hypothetical protein